MSKKPYPSEKQDRYIVRFPDGMRDRIAELAKMNNRSMNAEIVARLERSIDQDQIEKTDTNSPAIYEDFMRKVLETTQSTLVIKKPLKGPQLQQMISRGMRPRTGRLNKKSKK